MIRSKIIVVAIIALILFLFFFVGAGDYFTLDNLKAEKENLQTMHEQNRLLAALIFFLLYIVVTALSLPGAAIMTLAAGVIFGLLQGVVIVSFASTIGATLAFLTSRFVLRESIQKKFGEKLNAINVGIEKEGMFYLFTLRLIPLFPFFLINLLMGITHIKTRQFYWVSQLGMLPGTIVYVNAGSQIAELESMAGILSPELVFSFALLGLFPLLAKKFVSVSRPHKIMRNFKKPAHFDYNLVVIGAGAAGLVTSYIASAVKAKVVLIEKHKMGGDCLNTGCVPSKALIRSAKIMSYVKRANEFGFKNATVNYDFSDVMQRVQAIIKRVEPHDSIARYQSLGVDVIEGAATIKSPYSVEVNGKLITTRNIVVATGAKPLIPELPGLAEIDYFTSDTIWGLQQLPQHLLVLGGGPIGCELAQAFKRLGSEVTLVQRGNLLLPREDDDAAQQVQQLLESEGIKVLTGHDAIRIIRDRDNKILVCQFNSSEVNLQFDQILIALGRVANVSGFGLETLKLELTKSGTLASNEFLQTIYPNIFVCGDVAGPYQFTHAAAHQAWYASVNALFSPFKKFKVDYRVIPWATYTDPEVARVGLNEREAREKGIAYEVTKYGIDDLDRAIVDSEAHGFIKVLTVPGKDKILGVTIVGHHAADLISEYVLAMKHGLGLNKILGTIHIYPTLAEANKYVAGLWKQNHKPDTLLRWVEIFHRWRRKN